MRLMIYLFCIKLLQVVDLLFQQLCLAMPCAKGDRSLLWLSIFYRPICLVIPGKKRAPGGSIEALPDILYAEKLVWIAERECGKAFLNICVPQIFFAVYILFENSVEWPRFRAYWPTDNANILSSPGFKLFRTGWPILSNESFTNAGLNDINQSPDKLMVGQEMYTSQTKLEN